jgi:hypothetical protein
MNVRNSEITDMTNNLNERAATEIPMDWVWAWTGSEVWEQKKS